MRLPRFARNDKRGAGNDKENFVEIQTVD